MPREAEATHALYERYAGQVFRYCLHQLGSREEAEDAVQSTFLNAFRGLRRGVVPELESAWLFKIAHNVCLSRRRSTWRRGRVESPADFERVEQLAPAPSARADELIGLQDVLEGMPEQQRRAILLREWQGLSYREIADELELSQSAVETLIFRARRSLASGLERPVETPPRRRTAPAAALANLFSAAQGWLFGSTAAVKVAATVAVLGAGTVVATAPVEHLHAPPKPHTPAHAAVVRPATTHAAPAPATPVQAAAPVRPAPAARRHTAAPVRRAAPSKLESKPKPAPAATVPVVPVVPAPEEPQSPPAAPAAREHGKAHEQHGRATAPGQLKKQQPPAAQAPVEPAPVEPAPVEAAPVESAPVLPSEQSQGAGHGNGYGRDDAPGQTRQHGNGK